MGRPSPGRPATSPCRTRPTNWRSDVLKNRLPALSSAVRVLRSESRSKSSYKRSEGDRSVIPTKVGIQTSTCVLDSRSPLTTCGDKLRGNDIFMFPIINMMKILVVDDEKDILTLLEYNLKKAGFKVISAQDGPDALALSKKEKPDLIILDIMLPGMEGTEVCKILKGEEGTRHIPIIMLTAKGEEIDRIVEFELGAADFILKPFSPRVRF